MHDRVAELFNRDYQVQYIHNEEGQVRAKKANSPCRSLIY